MHGVMKWIIVRPCPSKKMKSGLNGKSSILADKVFCIGGFCARLSTDTTSDGAMEEFNFPIAERRCKLGTELKPEEQREAM